MRFALLNTDYQGFVDWLYTDTPGLADRSYRAQFDARLATYFAEGDAHSAALREMGHESSDFFVNNVRLQRAWALEHRLPSARVLSPGGPRRFMSAVPWLGQHRGALQDAAMLDVLAAQLEDLRPEIVIDFAAAGLPGGWLRQVVPEAMIVGFAEPPSLTTGTVFDEFDLVLAPSERMLEIVERQGAKGALVRFGFDDRVLRALPPDAIDIPPISFVGSLSPLHSARLTLIETLCAHFGEQVGVWGILDNVSRQSPVRPCYHGPAFGLGAYRIMRSSAVTINVHSDVEPIDADNMRLFEATGVGACLVTDRRANLAAIFEPGREVLDFGDSKEAVSLIHALLADEPRRRAVGQAGQKRTLRDHTYAVRSHEILSAINSASARGPDAAGLP
jgi:spore maturation protein CgeB